MFLIRSAFWLGLALVVLHPQDWDLGAQAQAAGNAAVTMGKQVAVQQIKNTECDSFECAGTKALIMASGVSISPLTQASTMQDSLSPGAAPVPRPRLNRAG